ncbi:hypothetical protein D3C76_1669340 [compost metagenome]
MKRFIASKITPDLFKQLALRPAASLRIHHIPEYRMEVVTCSVEGKLTFPMLHQLEVARLSSLLKLFLSFIQIVDIGFVMLLMVNTHR